jgi:hypothetical protein
VRARGTTSSQFEVINDGRNHESRWAFFERTFVAARRELKTALWLAGSKVYSNFST